MQDVWTRIVEHMVSRVSGPMKFRLVLQPVMASIFAIRSGLADAKAGRAPYFWTLVSDPAQRDYMIKDGWKGVGKVFILALVLDVVYQIIVLRFVYPGEAISRRFHPGHPALPDSARIGHTSGSAGTVRRGAHLLHSGLGRSQDRCR